MYLSGQDDCGYQDHWDVNFNFLSLVLNVIFFYSDKYSEIYYFLRILYSS